MDKFVSFLIVGLGGAAMLRSCGKPPENNGRL